MIEIRQLTDWPEKRGSAFASPSPQSLTASQLDAFVFLSGDENPIHRGDAALVPGNLLLSLVPQFVQQNLALAAPLIGLSLGYDKVRFKHPVQLGDPLCFAAKISQVRLRSGAAYVTYQIKVESADQTVMSLEMRDLYCESMPI